MNAPRICKKCGITFDTADRHIKCSKCRSIVTCSLCGGDKHRRSVVCNTCTKRTDDKNGNWRGGKIYHKKGYVMIRIDEEYVFEHRLVMEEILGRKLLNNENVHHLNGVRSDNRPENLELWIITQPSGQRVDDRIHDALEILRLYRPELLSESSQP